MVPAKVAVCPKCGGELWTSPNETDNGGDFFLDCENAPVCDVKRTMPTSWDDTNHRVQIWLETETQDQDVQFK